MTTWQILAAIVGAVVAMGVAYVVAKRVRKERQKNRFQEYGAEVHRFELARLGSVEFAQWLHPKEQLKEITQAQVDRLRQFVRPGDTVIDIGAYTGDTTVPLALAAGEDGCVLALEPNRYVFKVLKKNASLNRKITHIVPLNIAATDRDGTFTFHYSDASFCNGGYLSQMKTQRHGHRHALEVHGKKLSSFLRREFPERLARLTYIKVDAEGYDRQVIESLRDLIAEFRPTVVCEVYKRLDDSERSQLFDVLASQGYDCFKLSEGAEMRGEPIARDGMNKWKHFDIVAVPRAVQQRAAA